MKNKKEIKIEILFLSLCLLIAAGGRIVMLVFMQMIPSDPMGLYESARVSTDYVGPVMTSGIACVYTQLLHALLRFTGNVLSAACVLQCVLFTVSLLPLYIGCRNLIGKTAAYLAAFFCMIYPPLWSLTTCALPDALYLLGWSFTLMLVGFYANTSMKRGWHRKSCDELFFAILGFLLGILLIWHPLTISLVAVLIFAICDNFAELTTRRRSWKRQRDMNKLLAADPFYEEEGAEEKEVMPFFSQILLLFGGLVLGCFATLMKYTGLSGDTLIDQMLAWGKRLFLVADGRWQDLEISVCIFLPAMMLLVILVQKLLVPVFLRREERADGLSEDMDKQEKQGEDVTFSPNIRGKEAIMMENAAENANRRTERNRQETTERVSGQISKATPECGMEQDIEHKKEKVKYIENPLPGPKKHVKRSLDFKLDEKDDFDIDIAEGDDFDIP